MSLNPTMEGCPNYDLASRWDIIQSFETWQGKLIVLENAPAIKHPNIYSVWFCYLVQSTWKHIYGDYLWMSVDYGDLKLFTMFYMLQLYKSTHRKNLIWKTPWTGVWRLVWAQSPALAVWPCDTPWNAAKWGLA